MQFGTFCSLGFFSIIENKHIQKFFLKSLRLLLLFRQIGNAEPARNLLID